MQLPRPLYVLLAEKPIPHCMSFLSLVDFDFDMMAFTRKLNGFFYLLRSYPLFTALVMYGIDFAPGNILVVELKLIY